MTQTNLNLPLLRKRIRQLYGSQSAFARHCGWSRQYVSGLLGGHSSVSLRRAIELAAALELPVDELLEAEALVDGMSYGESEEPLEDVLREVEGKYADVAPSSEIREEEALESAEMGQPTGLESWRPQRHFADEAERSAFVRSLRGKYRDTLTPSEAFLRRKHEETAREEAASRLRS